MAFGMQRCSCCVSSRDAPLLPLVFSRMWHRRMLTQAGKLKLYLWYETRDAAEEHAPSAKHRWKRFQVPGTPIDVECSAGEPSAATSYMHVDVTDGLSSSMGGDALLQPVDMFAGESALVPSGGALIARALICDAQGNAVPSDLIVGEGAEVTSNGATPTAKAKARGTTSSLHAHVRSSDGTAQILKLSRRNGGSGTAAGEPNTPTTLQFTYEPPLRRIPATYSLHVSLGGVPLYGTMPSPLPSPRALALDGCPSAP